MKFNDFFVPKIARSNPRVREKAVLECTGTDQLQLVKKNEKDEYVRDVDKQRIEALKNYNR